MWKSVVGHPRNTSAVTICIAIVESWNHVADDDSAESMVTKGPVTSQCMWSVVFEKCAVVP